MKIFQELFKKYFKNKFGMVREKNAKIITVEKEFKDWSRNIQRIKVQFLDKSWNITIFHLQCFEKEDETL